MKEPPKIPDATPFCQLCQGSWPDGHEAWCPLKTGEAQAGALSEQQLYGYAQQAAGSLMGMANLGSEFDFVGGPLDGPNFVHAMANSILQIKGDCSGQYELLLDGKFHWIRSVD